MGLALMSCASWYHTSHQRTASAGRPARMCRIVLNLKRSGVCDRERARRDHGSGLSGGFEEVGSGDFSDEPQP
eukprot:5564067-Prymnesium_polylepis.1